MDYELHYIIAFVGGLIAGGINTLAGNGSMITLAILTEVLGLSGNVANATNRLGIFLNCIGGLRGFSHTKELKIKRQAQYVIPLFLGAIIGLWLAIVVSNKQFIVVYKVMMIVLFAVILIKPDRWIKKEEQKPRLSNTIMSIGLFILGIYGGFIQMGMGLLFLAITVIGAGIPILKANALKLLIVLLYTFIGIILFQWRGLIHWEVGLVLGLGQFLGGWIIGYYSPKVKKIEKWTYRLLVLMVGLAILKIFGVIYI